MLLLMLSLTVCALSANVLSFPDSGDGKDGVHWALIIAGSNEWYNYRHQADACHAYQIMRKHGIPESRIVTMMYDDIAHNSENPTPGVVINHPNGKDVYHGVVIDYKGEDVSPTNFLAALSGKEHLVKGGTGKVIKSGPKDHIFVNFADHGAPGIIAFPGEQPPLHARDLMNTLLSMYANKQYAQMVLYIEACESGSMFDGLLPNNISVFATTAANPDESSYACYFDNKYKTYLGDVYSVNWMEDSDKEDLSTETLQKQFEIVKKETNTSHVMEYGDLSISEEHVADFQSDSDGNYAVPEPLVLPKVPFDAVPSEEVQLSILYHRLMSAANSDEQHKIEHEMKQLLELRQQVRDTVQSIVRLSTRDDHQSGRILGTRYRLTAFDCYEPVVELFNERCFRISKNDYARKQLYVFVNLCQERVSTEKIMEMIAKVCTA